MILLTGIVNLYRPDSQRKHISNIKSTLKCCQTMVNRMKMFLLLIIVIPKAASVKVFSLQTDIWSPSTNDVYMRYDFPQSNPLLHDFTICYRYKRTVFSISETHFSYAVGDIFNALLFHRDVDKYMKLMYNKEYPLGSQTFEIPTTLYTWTHFCHVFSNVYNFYVDGVRKFSSPWILNRAALNMTGTLIIGQEQDQIGGGFNNYENIRGYMTQFNIWNKSLENNIIKNIADYQKDLNGNIFSSDTDDLTLNNVEVTEVNYLFLNSNNNYFLKFKDLVTFHTAGKLCDLIGSQVYFPNSTIQREILTSATNGARVWVGITDEKEEGVWRNYHNTEIIPDVEVAANGGVNENCVQLKFGIFEDYSCSEIAENACRHLNEGTIYLRGLCFATEMETRFLPTKNNTHLILQGLFGYMIVQSDFKWELKDVENDKVIAGLSEVSNNFYPIGCYNWDLKAAKCGYKSNETIIICLSKCNLNQFTCDDGECIPNNERCNSKIDCRDYSDEMRCQLLEIPPGYMRHIPPDDVNSSIKLPLYVDMHILRFPKIVDSDNLIEIEFILSIVWIDSRLFYNNLRQNYGLNKLTVNNIDKIWLPKQKFLNIIGGGAEVMEQKIEINRTGDPLVYKHNEEKMDVAYNGSSASIIYTQELFGKFECTFDVFYYPLDRQDCLLRMKLGNEEVEVPLDKLRAWYSGSTYLNAFQVDNVTSLVVNENNDECTNDIADVCQTNGIIEVKITLIRRPMYALVSTFLPSVMILAIGYSTYFLKSSIIQDRLIVAITSLLVLLTLFNQVGDTLPKTAYVKMIDHWFLFSTALLLIVNLSHMFIDVPNNNVRIVGKCRKEYIPTAAQFHKIISCIILPAVFIVFVLVFWLVMVYQPMV